MVYSGIRRQARENLRGNWAQAILVAVIAGLLGGHKWELFVLMLSFIGREFLSALTLGIGFLWVVPYKNAAMAVFCREISGPQIHTAE